MFRHGPCGGAWVLDRCGIAAYKPLVQAVIETRGYLRDAVAVGVSEDERDRIVDFIAANPRSGELIVGTGGARKVRFAGRGRGKSGGYRVITFFSGTDTPVFLLSLFSKGDRVDLSQAERNDMRRELAGLVDDYRAGQRKRTRRDR